MASSSGANRASNGRRRTPHASPAASWARTGTCKASASRRTPSSRPPAAEPARARLIQLGGAYAHRDVPSGPWRFEEAFELAATSSSARRGEKGGEKGGEDGEEEEESQQQLDDLAAVRAEGCRALANMAFLCVHMSRQGVSGRAEASATRASA